MKLKELMVQLERTFPFTWQEDYDNSGLILGDPETEIGKILVTLDVTIPVLNEAVENGCNLIIAHHPFIFKGIRKIIPDQLESSILISAIRGNIAIIAIHTNLDNALHGLNSYLGGKLGMKNISVLQPKTGLLSKFVTFCPNNFAEKVRNALFDAGAGYIGNYDCCSYNLQGEGTFRGSDSTNPFVGEKNKLHKEKETRIEVIFPNSIQENLIQALKCNHPYEEVAYDIYPLANRLATTGPGIIGDFPESVSEMVVLLRIKEMLEIPVIRHSPLRNRLIKRIAICSGSCSPLIPQTIQAGADMYITADLKYHDFFLSEDKIILCDIGHYESEKWVKDILAQTLNDFFPNFATVISSVNTNPINYF